MVRFSGIALMLLYVLSCGAATCAEPDDFSETLMRSTFKIEQGGIIGSSFLMATPDLENPTRGHFVLLTATHVFEAMPGDTATLHLRIEQDGGFTPLLYDIAIRNAGAPLWVSHPLADVAALRVALPAQADYRLVSTEVLATAETIKRYELQPGEEVLVLGFPFGKASDAAGFPVLRGARIASYPILSSKESLTFLLDMEVFPGNSGGPVFLSQRGRYYGGTIHMDTYNRAVLGVVSLEEIYPENVVTEGAIEIRKHRLGLARAVHASFIAELLAVLPPPN